MGKFAAVSVESAPSAHGWLHPSTNEECLVGYIQLVSEVKTTNVAGLTLDFARRLEVLCQVRGPQP
jgi:hypothetical protein